MKKIKFTKFNKLAQLFAAKFIADDNEGGHEEWNFIADLWVAVLPVRGSETIIAFQEKQLITHCILGRFIEGIPANAKLCIRWQERVFIVRHWFAVEEDKNYIEFWTYVER